MKYVFQLLIVLVFVVPIYAQQDEPVSPINLEAFKPILKPVEPQTIYPGDELVIQLSGFNEKNIPLKFNFNWSFGGKIDQQTATFRWRAEEKHIGVHPIIFTAFDTVTNQQVSQPAIVSVKPIQYTPTIQIKSNRKIPDGFWHIQEGEDLALVIEASDQNADDQLQLNYFVDRDISKKLDNATFNVNDRVATFLWTPDNDQAKKKYVNITFQAEDNTGLKCEKTIQMLVQDIQHVPVFVNKTNEFFIDEGEMLSFTVQARDADQEKLTYKLLSSEIKQNDFYFNGENGQFQWKPTFEYAQRNSDYSLIFSASDDVHTIYDTILVKVDPINYPPEIEPIRDREIREDEELTFQLLVKDKNGDENLKVSVAESDITDYSFDEKKREFRWKPGYDFVTNLDKKTVYTKFKVTDSFYEDEQTAKITVYDREDPAQLQTSYIQNLQFARKIFAEVDTMDKKVSQSVKSKRQWNRVFDISNILVSAFVGIASSSLMSEKVQQSAVPIGATITALIGIRSVLDKSDRNLPELKTQAVLLLGNMESSINYLVREYSEKPNLLVTDTRRFKNDLTNFKEKIEFFDSQKEKLRAELSINKL